MKLTFESNLQFQQDAMKAKIALLLIDISNGEKVADEIINNVKKAEKRLKKSKKG